VTLQHLHRTALVLALASVSMACSCSHDLAVVNDTDQPVTITVYPERAADPSSKFCDCPDGFTALHLATATTADSAGFEHVAWDSLPASATKFVGEGDSRGQSTTVELLPGRSMRVGTVGRDCAGGLIAYRAPLILEARSGGVIRSWEKDDFARDFTRLWGSSEIFRLSDSTRSTRG
jgi:hypothetical protein